LLLLFSPGLLASSTLAFPSPDILASSATYALDLPSPYLLASSTTSSLDLPLQDFLYRTLDLLFGTPYFHARMRDLLARTPDLLLGTPYLIFNNI
jgi:hypothetical protein